MSTITDSTTVRVLKFKESGVVAFCKEVIETVGPDGFMADLVDLDSAQIESDERCFIAKFDRKDL